MEDFLLQMKAVFVEILTNLTNPDQWKVILSKPEFFWAAFAVVNLIVFTETGLLIGFFLPGDSLLVTLGIVAQGYWSVESTLLLTACLCVCAVLGDSVGYWIGYKAGPRLFQKEKSWLFRKDYLLAAQAFYEKHGGKTIIIARFIPIIRTFAPVVAGIGRMDYRRFLLFNIAGGVSWICSMMLLGYTLHLWAEPMVNWIGRRMGRDLNFKVERNIDLIVVIIVLISVGPIAWKFLLQRIKRRKAAVEVK